MVSMSRSLAVISTPIGRLRLEAEADQLTGVAFHAPEPLEPPTPATVLSETARQLNAYCDRRLLQFDLPLAPQGTPFQLSVWEALCRIPYGATWTYADVARHIERPRAVRAVGAANGRNPIPIIVPCHRVIGRSGRLVGFGGGLEMKRALLALEQGALF